MDDYDRRTGADPKVNRLTPLAQQAANEFKEGLAKIQVAYNTLKLIEQEARQQLPKHYHRNRLFPQPGDSFDTIAEYARSLREELDKTKALAAKGVVSWFDELASETKAHMGE
jgi:hypothetical protein